MDSKYHFLSSAAVGAPAAFSLSASLEWGLLLTGYAAALGTLIDVDHFLIARYRSGSWRAVRACVRDPRLVLFDRSEIFRVGDVGKLHRLLSHVALGGLLVGVLFAVVPPVAGLSALVLYVHLLLDLIHDVRGVREQDIE